MRHKDTNKAANEPLHNEKAIIAKAQSGDSEAFTELVNFYSKKVEFFLCQKTRDPHRALDISQITWVKIWKKIKYFRGDSLFSTWCFRVATNAFLDERRKDKKYLLFEDFKSEDAKSGEDIIAFFYEKSQNDNFLVPTPTDLISEKESVVANKKELHRLLSLLEGPMKRIVELVLVKNLSYKEAAIKERIPVGTVMSRLFYAKKKMQSFRRGQDAVNVF